MFKVLLRATAGISCILIGSSMVMGACPSIPGNQIIKAYCASNKNPYVVSHGDGAGLYESAGAGNPDCTNPLRRKALSARKKFEKQLKIAQKEDDKGCHYQFHVGKENDPKRSEYNFVLTQVRR